MFSASGIGWFRRIRGHATACAMLKLGIRVGITMGGPDSPAGRHARGIKTAAILERVASSKIQGGGEELAGEERPERPVSTNEKETHDGAIC